MCLGNDVCLKEVADICEYFTGADFKALLYNAQLQVCERCGYLNNSYFSAVYFCKYVYFIRDLKIAINLKYLYKLDYFHGIVLLAGNSRKIFIKCHMVLVTRLL